MSVSDLVSGTYALGGVGTNAHIHNAPSVTYVSQLPNHDKPKMSMFSVVCAAAFAAKWHGSQTRKDAAKTAYITHPLMVAAHLESVGCDEQTKIAGILHDVLEDTGCTENEMILVAGAEITSLVLEVTHNKYIPREQKHTNLVHQLSSMSERALMIKVADRTHNLRDVKDLSRLPDGFTEAKVFDYARKSRELYVTIQNRSLQSSSPLLKLLRFFDRAIRDIEDIEFAMNEGI